MNKEFFIGLDIGGTAVKQGIFTRAGEKLGNISAPTPPLDTRSGYDAVLHGIDELVSSVGGSVDDVRAIGLAVPCPIPANGHVGVIANLKLDLLALQHELELHCPSSIVTYVNDANAAAMGEVWRGGAQGLQSCVFITLGTGVGGGVVINGKVADGASGAAGEIGHICLNPSEPLTCGCGRHGCLEQYASARGIVRLYRDECARRGQTPTELVHDGDTLSLFGAYQTGSEAAKAAVSTMCDYLGLALSIVSGVVDPERYVLGGGVAGALPLFHDELEERFRHYVLSCCADTPIVSAELGNNAGMFGAAYVGLQELASAS